MAVYYKVHRVMNGLDEKTDRRTMIDEDRREFGYLEGVLKWIEDEYGGLDVQRDKVVKNVMFVDTKRGKTKKVGVTISFNNADLSHSPVEQWRQEDWIEITKVEESRVPEREIKMLFIAMKGTPEVEYEEV